MRVRSVMFVSLLVALLMWAPTVSAGKCVIEDGNRRIEYECPDSESEPTAAADPPWANDTAQAIYAFIGFGASAGGAAYAYFRIKRRRDQLTAFIKRVDTVLAESRADPAAGVAAMALVRRDVRSAFDSGRIDDAHFLDLDKRVSAGMQRLRVFELDRRFPTLPSDLRGRVISLLGDGTVTEAEVDILAAALGKHILLGPTRHEVVGMVSAWAAQDTGRTSVPVMAEPESEPLVRLRDS